MSERNASSISDNDLIERVLANDTAAFSQLYDRYSGMVLGMANRILSDRALAEEVMQEAFWRVWQQMERYNPEQGKFVSWLMRIARNMAIDAWRKKIRTVPAQELLEETLQSEGNATPKQLIQKEQFARVRHAVEALPDEQRAVIEQAYFKGKTRRQIAADNNIPLGTIHTRARLALQKLQQSLAEQGLGDS